MPAQIKYGISTNCLHKTHTIDQIAQLCRRVGLNGIEWGLFDKDQPKKEAVEMTAAARQCGIETAGFLNAGHLWNTDLMHKYSEAVAAANGKYLRVTPPWVGFDYNESLHQKASFQELFKCCRQGFENLEKMGPQYGIRYIVETHMGSLCASPCIARMLMEGLNPAYVGILWDPANGIMEGFIRPRMAIEIMGEYLASVHAKNLFLSFQGISNDSDVHATQWQFNVCDLASGVVNWSEVVFGLKCTQYTGWITFEEFFKASPEQKLGQAVAYMKQIYKTVPDKPQEPFTTFND